MEGSDPKLKPVLFRAAISSFRNLQQLHTSYLPKTSTTPMPQTMQALAAYRTPHLVPRHLLNKLRIFTHAFGLA
jgi:hypothetical protein